MEIKKTNSNSRSEKVKNTALSDTKTDRALVDKDGHSMPRIKGADSDLVISVHNPPACVSDYLAYKLVKLLRFFADTFFKRRYGHRAVVLETVAGVPGMVGGMLQHLKSLRRCEDDKGWIQSLLAEAENERMHLMTFIQIARPNIFERALIVFTQIIFFTTYFVMYLLSPRFCHRFVSYLEEEAVYSYTQYLAEIHAGKIEDIPAPQSAIKYWELKKSAKLSDLVRAIREDEARHRDKNHAYANVIAGIHHTKENNSSIE